MKLPEETVSEATKGGDARYHSVAYDGGGGGGGGGGGDGGGDFA